MNPTDRPRCIGSLFLFITIFLFSAIAWACDETYPTTPQDVVQAYLKEDFTRGKNYWERISKFTTWADGPGWDESVLVSGYRITGGRQHLETAQVDVEYLDPVHYSFDDVGPVLGNYSASETVTFELIKKNGCWKINSPQNPPHLNAKYVISDLSARSSQQRGRPVEVLRQLRMYYNK